MWGRMKPALLIRTLVCVVILFGAAFAHASDIRVLFDSGGERPHNAELIQSLENQGLFSATKRIQRAKPHAALSQPGKLAAGDAIRLDLFETTLDAVVEQASVNRLGTISIRGRLEDFPKGYFSISTTRSKSLAIVRIPEKNQQYKIVYNPLTKAHYMAEMDPAGVDILDGGPPLLPEKGRKTSRSPLSAGVNTQGNAPDDEDVTITIMVVYTSAAKDWADDSGGGIENVISEAMALTQLVLDNSKTHTQLELVYAGEVTDSETGSSRDILRDLTEAGNGYMDEVHDWRDNYNADLVTLFANVGDLGGISYQLTNEAGDPEYGFSLVRVQQAARDVNHTFAHEIGHNLGLGHHKEQNVEPGPGLFDYSAAWRWQGGGGNWYSTVMAYTEGRYYADDNDSTMLPYFSNPDVYHEGRPTGHYRDGDNARTVRQTRHVVAAYRPDGTDKPVIHNFSVESASIEPGENTILTWWVVNAENVTIETDTGTDIGAVEAAGELEISPSESTRYTLRAVNDAGTSSQSIFVTVDTAATDEPSDDASNNLPLTRDNGGGCFINTLTNPFTTESFVGANNHSP